MYLICYIATGGSLIVWGVHATAETAESAIRAHQKDSRGEPKRNLFLLAAVQFEP